MANYNQFQPDDDEDENQPAQQPAAAASGIDIDAPADEAPTDQEYQTVLARVKAMRQSAADPVDMAQYDKAELEAKQLYQDRANRAEWLSLADRIGNAATRIGAAKAGLKAGVDLSGINYGPGTDWEGKIDRYAKDYSTELGRVGNQRNAALRNQGEQYRLGETAFNEASREAAARGANLRAEAAREATGQRQDKQLAAAKDREMATLALKEKMDQEREERNLRTMDLKDIDTQEKVAQKQMAAKQTLYNQLLTSGDLTSKDRSKLQAQYGKLAGDAGVDLDSVLTKLNAEETRPRFLPGGRSADEDKAAKTKVLSQDLQQTKNLLDALRDQKRKRLGNSDAAEASAPPAPSDDGKVTVEKDGKQFRLPRAQLDQAQAQGYKLVQ